MQEKALVPVLASSETQLTVWSDAQPAGFRKRQHGLPFNLGENFLLILKNLSTWNQERKRRKMKLI